MALLTFDGVLGPDDVLVAVDETVPFDEVWEMRLLVLEHVAEEHDDRGVLEAELLYTPVGGQERRALLFSTDLLIDRYPLFGVLAPGDRLRVILRPALHDHACDAKLTLSFVRGLRDPDRIAHAATALGGRRAFNSTTNFVSIKAAGEQPLAAFVNPADSGVDCWIDLGEFASSHSALFRRYGGAAVTVTGPPQPANNMGGGPRQAAGKLYVPGNYTHTGGVVTKTAHIGAYSQYITRLAGRAVLRPGRTLAWTIAAGSVGLSATSMTGSVYLEWWEAPAE